MVFAYDGRAPPGGTAGPRCRSSSPAHGVRSLRSIFAPAGRDRGGLECVGDEHPKCFTRPAARFELSKTLDTSPIDSVEVNAPLRAVFAWVARELWSSTAASSVASTLRPDESSGNSRYPRQRGLQSRGGRERSRLVRRRLQPRRARVRKAARRVTSRGTTTMSRHHGIAPVAWERPIGGKRFGRQKIRRGTYLRYFRTPM